MKIKFKSVLCRKGLLLEADKTFAILRTACSESRIWVWLSYLAVLRIMSSFRKELRHLCMWMAYLIMSRSIEMDGAPLIKSSLFLNFWPHVYIC